MLMRVLGKLVVAGAAMLASSAMADLIYLTDGTWIRGTIVKETKDEVEIHGKTNSGIEFKGTIKTSQINSIIRSDPAPETKPDSKSESKPDAAAPASSTPTPATKPAETTATDKPKEAPGDYLVIPLKGTFGEDIYPKGVEMSVDWAVRKGVRTIVFVIDSPGGQLWAADAIQEIIKKNADKVSFNIVIKEAISASIWVVFSCEKIAATPGAVLGAAVAFKVSDTGETEVDEKFNSAIAGRLASYAETRGHSGTLVRSMILTDNKLFAIKSSPFSWTFSHDKPLDSAKLEVDTLSDGHRVVTLTADQMAKYKIASKMLGVTDQNIAEFLGDSKLKSAGNTGETNMRTAAQATAAVVKQIDNWAEGVVTAGELWRSAVKEDDVDRAIQATEDYLKQLRRIGGLRNQAKELGMLEYPALKRIDVEASVREADGVLVKLYDLRRRRQSRSER